MLKRSQLYETREERTLGSDKAYAKVLGARIVKMEMKSEGAL